MRLVTLAVAAFLIMLLVMGSDLREADIAEGVERDIINFTETNINLGDTKQQFFNKTVGPYPETNGSLINVQRIQRSINYMIYSVLGIGEEIGKMAVEFGYKRPLDYDILFGYIKYILIIVLVVVLIKPAGYFIIFFVMLILWIVDKMKARRNKKIKESGKVKGFLK